MLEIEHLRVGYGRHVVIDDASATLKRGELVCLLGANGAGKSTLLKVLGGMMPPLNGTVRIDGETLGAVSRRRLSTLVSVVNTDRISVDALTAREVVEMGRYPYSGFMGRLDDEDREMVERAMRSTGIESLAGRNVGALSDGERQKVMIARALAQATSVILLDEPTAFLDVASRVEVLTLLKQLAAEEGKGVLLSSHDIPSALELSDCVWMLPGDGTLRVDAPLDMIERQRRGEPGNPLDILFAGRNVRFDCARMDFVGIAPVREKSMKQ